MTSTNRKPRVLNYHKDGFPDGAVDIMRPGTWGNPYGMGVHEDRAKVLKRFEEYVRSKPALVAAAKSILKGKDLVCCCKPKRCHGDVWLKIANEDK